MNSMGEMIMILEMVGRKVSAKVCEKVSEIGFENGLLLECNIWWEDITNMLWEEMIDSCESLVWLIKIFIFITLWEDFYLNLIPGIVDLLKFSSILGLILYWKSCR